jgi:hypothetical protein
VREGGGQVGGATAAEGIIYIEPCIEQTPHCSRVLSTVDMLHTCITCIHANLS